MSDAPDTGHTPEPHNSNPHRSLVAVRGATGWWLSVDGTTKGAVYGCFTTQGDAERYQRSLVGAWDCAELARAHAESPDRRAKRIRAAADRLANACMVAAVNLTACATVKHTAHVRLEANNSHVSLLQAVEAYKREVDHA